MSWHAVRAVAEAAASTRSFLLPDERGRWLRLSTLALVVGVGWLAPVTAGWLAPPVLAPPTAAAMGMAVAIAVVADGYGRFTLLAGLRSSRLRPTERARRRLIRSLRWAGFSFGAGVLAVAATAVALRAIRGGWLAATGGTVVSPADAAVTGAAGVAAATAVVGAVGVVHATLSLLPATMLATGAGAMASWRRLWNAFAGRRGGFVGYLLVRGLVGVAVAGLTLLASAALVAVLAVVVFVALVGVFGTVSAAISTVGPRAFGVLGAVAAVGLVVLPIRAAATVYLTSYDLAVLGAVDADLALLGGRDSLPVDDASVVFPEEAPMGVSATDGGVASAGDGEVASAAGGEMASEAAGDANSGDVDTGAFQFDAVED